METTKKFKISQEMLLEWEKNDDRFILLDIDCGLGKTESILTLAQSHSNDLFLYLVSRVDLQHSIENRVKNMGLDNVYVMTIQLLYHTLKRIPDAGIILNMYKWIVIDEIQLGVLDSTFNKTMEPIVDMIVRKFQGRVMMLTGTDIGISDVFRDKYGITLRVHSMHKKIDWLYAGSIGFLPNIDTVIATMQDKIERGEKCLFFSSSIANIDKISTGLTQKTMAVVSKFARDAVRLCGKKRKLVQDLIHDESVPEGFGAVLATKSIDVGINIIDSMVTTIIVDSIEIATAIQQINRKRREKGESIEVYFLLPSGYKISANVKKYKAILNDYELFKNDFVSWKQMHAYERISEKGVIYAAPGPEESPVYKVDYWYLAYCRYMMRTALQNEKVSGYIAAVETAFGCQGVVLLKRARKTLEELVGVVLATKEEKKWLIEMFPEHFRSAARLNRLLEEKGLPYRIKTGVHKELPHIDGKRRECRSGWMLVRIDK